MRRSVFAFALALGLLDVTGCAKRDAPEAVAESRTRARPEPIKRDPRDEVFDAGAIAYAKYCALCHGPDAEGYAADHAPSLRSPTFLASATDDYIARAIREGRLGTAMAGYAKARGGPLDEPAVAAIIAFLRAGSVAPKAMSKAVIAGDAAHGASVYTARCERCHGTQHERGEAVHLANGNFLGGAEDEYLRFAIERGRPGTPMPSFEGVLDEGDIADVVALLRSWGPVSAPARPRGQVEPPPLGDFILNPRGKTPDFKLKQDRYVPNADVHAALEAHERMVIIDARATSDWFGMHIPGSISVPYYAFDRLDSMPRDGTWILAYCACPHHASGAVVDELRKRGYKKTAVLDEGVMAWKKAGYEMEGDVLDLADSKKTGAPPPPVRPLRLPHAPQLH